MNTRTITRTIKNPLPDMIYAIRNEREYDASIARLNALVDEVGDNPRHPKYRQIETLSVLIEAYDREHHERCRKSRVLRSFDS